MVRRDTAQDERFERAFGGALDNELAEGHDSDAARSLVLRRYRSYADLYDLDAGAFRAYVVSQLGAYV